MRVATLSLAVLGLLLLSTSAALAQPKPDNVSSALYVTGQTDQPTVTPVQWRVYRPAPAWRSYYRTPQYYTYGPSYYGWYGQPQYYNYYATPYSTYYYSAPSGYTDYYYAPQTCSTCGY